MTISASPGPRPTTMQDIADRCGVTRATVSLALRSDPRISEKTSEKVRSVADELGYDPMAHQAARRMGLRRHGREQLTRQVAVVGPRCLLEATYYRQLTDAVWRTLIKHGYSLQIVDADGVRALDRGDGFSSLLKPDEIDGMICMAHPDTLARAAELRKRAGLKMLPAISLTAGIPGFTCVRCDDHQAGQDLAKALTDLGHRQFLCLEPLDNAAQRDRWVGFAQTLSRLGYNADQTLAFHQCPTSWMDPVHARQRLRATDPTEHDDNFLNAWHASKATAIVCGNDGIALHARGALLRAGFETPDDVSLVGFDDADNDADPFKLLSSVDVGLSQMGELGVELLLEMIGKEQPEPREVLVKATINLRATVGPPRKA